MAFQSPLISIPKKTTTDVDWTNPLRQIIAQSYGEDPGTYSEECSVLQRCRQDAVKGAGSDQTARDLLYKYFGQLELLELRFAEIKVAFPWNDAFTAKLTTQSSLAFEKASVIHLLSSVLSSLSASGSRSDPEGVKRSYWHARAAAGMLTYINENFLHAPSTDLSREVVHLLIGVMMAQATEIFTEKLVDEKKAPALVSRSANQAASMYAALVDEMKEFQGKGVFDRNWLYVLQIKAKLFASSAQYYRSTADAASSKHGSVLVRMRLAETLAQDASRQASSFIYTFVSTSTPTIPNDAATSLQEITKAHGTLCTEAKAQATRDNDLIYHDILPSEASLPQIDKLPPAAPITIQDVYSNADVSKLIGPDIFVRLVPLAVHESASVYSEEKAKVVRSEVERVDMSEGEVRASLEHLGLPGVVSAWRRLAEGDDDGEGDVELSREVRRLAAAIQYGGNVGNMLRDLDGERERTEKAFRDLGVSLDNESRDCERMRSKYTPQFTQQPSGPQTASFRSAISTNLGSLSAAATSDSHISDLYSSIQGDIAMLSGGEDGLRSRAGEIAAGRQAHAQPGMSLLDLDDEVGSKSTLGEGEKGDLQHAISDVTDRLDRLGKVRRERDEVLKDLKEKIQQDDVSNLLLLNRRSQNVEPQLFASELEKFRPYQGRIAAAVQASKSILQELEMSVRQVEKGKGVKERQKAQKDRQRRIRDWERKLEQSGASYEEVHAGLTKGLSYYDSVGHVIADLRREVNGFIRAREAERNRMVSEIETRQRLVSSPPPPPGPPSNSRGLESHLGGLSLGGNDYGRSSLYATSPPPTQSRSHSTLSYASSSGFPPPPPHPATPSYAPLPPLHPATPSYAPPPPPQPAKSSPYNLSNRSNMPSAIPSASSASYQGHTSYSSPPRVEPPAQQRQSSYGSNYSYGSPGSGSATSPYPPPPQPVRPAQPSYNQYSSTPQYASYAAPLPSEPTYTGRPPSQREGSSYYPSSSQQSYPANPPPFQHPTYGDPNRSAQQHQQYASPPPQPVYAAPSQSALPNQQYAGGLQQPHSGYQSPPPQQYQQAYQPPSSGYQYR